MSPLRWAARRRGISLVSLMVAIALATMLSVTVVTSLVFTARTARISSYRLAARSVVQGVLEQMYAYPYDEITEANFPSIPSANPNALVLDSTNDLVCDLTVEIEGERQATNGSSSTLVCSGAGWETNRWQGDTVFLIGGRGFGQRARILTNTADTLNIQLLGFAGVTDWITEPDATTQFVINGGRTARVSASFDFRGTTYTETVEGLVVNDG